MVVNRIPAYRIKFDQEARQRIWELMQTPFDNGMVGDYTLCRKLEKEVLKLYPNFKYAVAVITCTTALEVVLKYLHAYKNCRTVSIQDHSFISDVWAAERSGLKHKLVDINEKDLIPESYFGSDVLLVAPIGGIVPHRLNELYLSPFGGKVLVVDAAHALGTKEIVGDFVTFSFGRIKIATGGTGGMILTNDDNFVEYARSMIEWGKIGHKNVYEGVSGIMSEWNAAVAIQKVEQLSSEIARRAIIAGAYNVAADNFGLSSKLIIDYPEKEIRKNYYRYYIYPKPGYTLDVPGVTMAMMNEFGIQLPANVYQYGIHEQNDYQSRYKTKDSDFPVTMRFTRNHICLPCYSAMSDKDINYVANSMYIIPSFVKKIGHGKN